MKLHELSPSEGAKKERRRIGRGWGSGRGKTSGRGQKGQKARAGGGVPPYFEGGQLPLVRRLPYRRGFTNPFRKEYQGINLSALVRFPANTVVEPSVLAAAGLCKAGETVKILGSGELSQPLKVRANRFSKTARAKIEAAGGSVEEL